MELLKYTQQIQEVYEALNLIYNGELKEDYIGAYNLLKANPLTNEFIHENVFTFITNCAKAQMDIKELVIDYSNDIPVATRVDGRYREDITAREMGESSTFIEEYNAEWSRGPSHHY